MTISAKIVADSVSPQGIRLTTMQLRYPKFIHGEFMTHRVFSRNASSSRAIPVERLIRDVLDDPVVPVHWGANQRGMQASEECSALIEFSEDTNDGVGGTTAFFSGDRTVMWDLARERAITMARAFAAAGYHKQIVNRLLEPFCHINVVVTATEWSNFFALRCHPDAQPEMRLLAEAMRLAMATSEPRKLRPGEWHLPYCQPIKLSSADPPDDDAIKISVARCARVSYLTQDGRESSAEEDMRLYERLVGSQPIHASPVEHQATPDEQMYVNARSNYLGDLAWKRPHLHGNLRGWCQFRKTLPGECQ